MDKILLKVIILAVIIRLLFLGSVPSSLNWDEVSQGYTAYSILQTGRDEWGNKLPLFFRSYGEWKSAVYIYLLVPFIQFMGLNATSVRLPSAIAGIISVYLVYLLGNKLYGRRVGLWSAFLMSVTPWTFLLGRPAFEANVALTLILGGTYLFLHYHLTSKIYLLISSAILLGLAPHTYNSAKIVVPLLVIYLLISTRFYQKLKPTLIYCGILALFAAPILWNLGSGASLARFNQVGVTTDLKKLDAFVGNRSNFPLPPLANKLVFNRYTYALYQTSANLLSYFNPSYLALNGGEHNQHRLPYHGVLYFTQFILVLLGLWQYRATHSRLPLVLVLLGFLPAAMTRDSYHTLRALFAAPGFVLLSALGIAHLQAQKPKLTRWVVGLLTVEIIIFLFSYFLWYPRAYARDWQFGHAQLSEYLSMYESDYDQIVMTKWYGEPQLFLAFYNRWDPRTYQEQNIPLLRYESEGRLWLDQLPVYSLGKYTFKYLDWNSETQDSHTLYIGKADDFPPDARTVHTINFPDGSVAFRLVEGDK